MKYYEKFENNTVGFYDEEIHGDILFNIDGESKTLKPEFQEISDERWLELLEGQSQGKEIRILKTGEIGLYTKPLQDKEYVNPAFNYETEKWEEKATKVEQLDYYKKKILEVTKEIQLEESIGFMANSELLRKKSYYIEMHLNVSHEIANRINN